jgi:hypothetical protein
MKGESKRGRIAGLPHSCRNACRWNAAERGFSVVNVKILETVVVWIQSPDYPFGQRSNHTD